MKISPTILNSSSAGASVRPVLLQAGKGLVRDEGRDPQGRGQGDICEGTQRLGTGERELSNLAIQMI